MFMTRLISGAILLAATVVLMILGGPVLLLAVAAISLVGMYELYKVFRIEKKWTSYLGFLGAMLIDLAAFLKRPDLALPLLVLCFLGMMALYVFTWPKFKAADVVGSFFGLVYVGLMLSYLYQTRAGVDGKFTCWLIFISAWGSDTMAYCAGRLFGKRPMAPELSPKKTVEGGIGGIAGAGLIGLIYGICCRGHLPEFSYPVLACALIGACGSLVAMTGDLAASAIKRNYGIKDYGKLIPGHGGIMDRFDSVIFTAPVIFYLVTALQHVK